MAFCTSCGGQLGEGERFCVKCGADQTAKAGGAAAAGAAAQPVAAPQPAAHPPFGAPAPVPSGHMPYVATGRIPMSTAMPPQAPAKKSGMMWLGLIVIAVGGYYYYTHYMHPTTPANSPHSQPAPQGQPGAPGQQPGAPGQQPGAPGQQPNAPGQQPNAPGQQPVGYPGQQPGGQGQGYSAQLAQMQSFTGQVTEENGDVEISNGRWTNNSTVAIQSATLECIQYSADGQPLTQNQITISGPNNGPVPPQDTIPFDPFAVGAVVPGATSAKCGIVAAVPAG